MRKSTYHVARGLIASNFIAVLGSYVLKYVLDFSHS
jgi:hypothetical protein